MPTAVCPVLRARNARGIDRLNQSCFLRSFVFIFIAINATPNDGRICCCWNRTDLAVEDLQVACKISMMGFVCRNVTALTTPADTECRAVTSTGKVRICDGSRSGIITYGVFRNAILYTYERLLYMLLFEWTGSTYRRLTRTMPNTQHGFVCRNVAELQQHTSNTVCRAVSPTDRGFIYDM